MGAACGHVQEARPQRLLALAFSEPRNLELRLPEVPYARVVVLRAGSTGSFGSPELAEAEAAVLRQTKSGSASPAILEPPSRVPLVRGRGDDAPGGARDALDSVWSGAELDLGIAYWGRGLVQQP